MTTTSTTTAALFAALDAAVARSALRRLDVAFARFLDETSRPEPAVLLAAAMLAQAEGRGHSCLPLEDLAAGPEALLGPRAKDSGLASLDVAIWPTDIDAWRTVLARAEAVCADPSASDTAARPLVLAGTRLYLRRYWGLERRVADEVRARAARETPLDPALVRGWLDRLFGPARADAPDDDPDWQRIAVSLALRGGFTVITGGPGTGKTYTAARLLAALFATAPDASRLRVALAAPTGKAAARLKSSIDAALQSLVPAVGDALPLAELAGRVGAARTLHSLLGARPGTRRLRHHAGHPLDVDVLVVDEASMVHLEMMAALLDALPATARLVLLGDKDQLASVEAGAVLGDLCRDAAKGRYDDATAAWVAAATGEDLPAPLRDASGPRLAQRLVMLRRSQRFGGAIGALAVAVNAGRADDAMRALREPPGEAVHWLRPADAGAVAALAVQGREGAAGTLSDYLRTLAAGRPARDADARARDAWAREVLAAFDRCRVLSAVREGPWGVSGLNAAIARALAAAELLKPRGEWYEGRPVLVTRNDAGLGVFNGDIGIALRVPVPGTGDDALRVFFPDGAGVRSVAVGRLADVETAFAMTVHKSQGSEFAHTVLVLPPESAATATRELVYTGLTRAREALTLVAPDAQALAEAIGRQTRRASGLDWR